MFLCRKSFSPLTDATAYKNDAEKIDHQQLAIMMVVGK